MQVKDISDALVLCYFSKPYEAKPILQLLQEEHKIPGKVALRKIEQMVNKDILEYGCSINYVWTTK